MNEHEKHLIEYLVLTLGLAVFAGLFVMFRFNKPVLIYVALFGCVFYMLWGIVHHYLEGRLTELLAAEYILIGFLIFLLLFNVLLI